MACLWPHITNSATKGQLKQESACLLREVWEDFLEELDLNWTLREDEDVGSVTSGYKGMKHLTFLAQSGVAKEQVGAE